jgi:hypothetical protein
LLHITYEYIGVTNSIYFRPENVKHLKGSPVRYLLISSTTRWKFVHSETFYFKVSDLESHETYSTRDVSIQEQSRTKYTLNYLLQTMKVIESNIFLKWLHICFTERHITNRTVQDVRLIHTCFYWSNPAKWRIYHNILLINFSILGTFSLQM